MDRRYKHLDSEERGVILAEHRRGASLREIGGRLGDAPYDPQVARSLHDARRLLCRPRAKLVQGSPLHDWVRGKLVHQSWSPEQIAARLRAMHPDDPTARVSHETIYAAIYAQPRGALKAAMVLALRQAKPARGLRRTTLAGSSMVPESLRIIHRPEEIEGRLIPGHWEGDLIKGAFNRSSVGTLVERKTRFVVLCKMDGNTAAAALVAFTRQMKHLPREIRKSMTYDRGSEMACHPELARRLKIDICFCDPHAPWQRGSNENTNGLLAPVHAQGYRPQRCLADLAQRRRQIDEWATKKDPRLEDPRRSHGRRNQGLQFNRCTCYAVWRRRRSL